MNHFFAATGYNKFTLATIQKINHLYHLIFIKASNLNKIITNEMSDDNKKMLLSDEFKSVNYTSINLYVYRFGNKSF